MDEDLLPLSALQHYLYCPRQCALIHVERQWAENRLTAEGRVLHERADRPALEQRHGVRTVTALPLVNRALGIFGVADVVEFCVVDGIERAYPVEYKRGRPKSHRADEVQLCAQALCLESMLGTPVDAGALYYGTRRRRTPVRFDQALRDLTLSTIVSTAEMIAAGRTPRATYDGARCDACSLIELCLPRLLGRAQSVSEWIVSQMAE